MSDTKKVAELKRDNTMQVTAKEGIRLLKDAGEHVLLEMQGLQRQSDEPNVDDEDVGDDGHGQDDGDPEQPGGSPSSTKPRLQRISTMAVTAKEGEAFLATQAENKTKNQQQQKEDQPKEEPATKKLKTNSEKDDNKKPVSKRVSTLLRTAKEGEELLKEMGHKDDDPDSERRRTRSQTRAGPAPASPPIKKANSTEKAGLNNGGKRGRKGRPRKELNDDDKSASSESEDTTDKKKSPAAATTEIEDKTAKDGVKKQPTAEDVKSNDEPSKQNDKN